MAKQEITTPIMTDTTGQAIASANERIADALELFTNDIYTKEQTDELLDDKVDKVEGKGLSTNDFTNTDKENIPKALYHLGAFDSQDGKTRQTGVLYGKDLSSSSVAEYDNITYYKIPKPTSALDYGTYSYNAITNKYPTYQGSNWNSTECIGKISGYAETGYYWVGFTKGTTLTQALTDFQDLVLQYKLATAYVDNGIIEGETILPLDSNMASKIRQKVVDGLNLLTGKIRASGIFNGYEFIPEESGTYTLSLPNNVAELSCQNNETLIDVLKVYNTNTITVNLVANTRYGFFANNNTSESWSYIVTIRDVMLTKSNYTYPHSDFNQKEHITNAEATLLKNEYEKCSNLWDEQWEVGGLVADALNSKNFIPVKPNTTYYLFIGPDGTMGKDIYFYTSSQTLISIIGTSSFTTPSNCYYIKFRLGTTYGTTYNHDIMLNKGTSPEPYHDWCGEIVHGDNNIFYRSDHTYAVNQVVFYNGYLYVCIQASTGNLPTNTTYWQPLFV